MPAFSSTRRRWLRKRSVALAMIAIAVALVWGSWKRMTEWGFHRALPANAEDIHEWFQEDGFLPDYAYILKAKISEEEFHRYINRFQLTPHFPGRQYSEQAEIFLRWRSGAIPDMAWWDPSESLAETFVRQAGDNWTFAKWEGGYLYLKSLEH